MERECRKRHKTNNIRQTQVQPFWSKEKNTKPDTAGKKFVRYKNSDSNKFFFFLNPMFQKST